MGSKNLNGAGMASQIITESDLTPIDKRHYLVYCKRKLKDLELEKEKKWRL